MSELNERKVKTRIIHKHDIPENWEQAVNFVPKQGELIIYDDRYTDKDGNEIIVADTIRYKIGDGTTQVNALPFVDAGNKTKIYEQVMTYNYSFEDAMSLDGYEDGCGFECLVTGTYVAPSISYGWQNQAFTEITPTTVTINGTNYDSAEFEAGYGYTIYGSGMLQRLIVQESGYQDVVRPDVELVQSTGEKETAVMSQKAVTNALNAINGRVYDKNRESVDIYDIVELSKGCTLEFEVITEGTCLYYDIYNYENGVQVACIDVSNKPAGYTETLVIPPFNVDECTINSEFYDGEISYWKITETPTDVGLVQTTGTSETDVMSQKAVTDALPKIKATKIENKPVIHIYRSGDDGDWDGTYSATNQLIAGETYFFHYDDDSYGDTVNVYLTENGTEILRATEGADAFPGSKTFVAKEGASYQVHMDSAYGNVWVEGPIVVATPINEFEISNEFGNSETAAMSQKAVTEKFVGSKLSDKEIPEYLYNELIEETATDLNYCYYYGAIPAGAKLKLTLFYTQNEYNQDEDYNPWRTRGLILPEGLPHNGETVIVEANGEEVVIYDTRGYYGGETSLELCIAGVEDKIDILEDKVKDESEKSALKFDQIDSRLSSLWTKKDEWIYVGNIEEEIKLGGTFILTATFDDYYGGSITYEITDSTGSEYNVLSVAGHGFQRSEELTLLPNPNRIVTQGEYVAPALTPVAFYRKNDVNLINGNGINIEKENDNLEISVDADYIKTIEVNNAVSAQSAQSAESVEWTSVKTRPAINQGNVATAIVINEGSSSGKYSIAGGTNDKDIITEMVGSTIANGITVNVPTATADAAISFGTGTEVNTIGGIALGAMTVAGVKGYYWDEIDFNAKTITITSERRSSKYTTPTAADISDWAIDDVISLVNEQNYPAFAKITAKSGNKITVDNIPFTEIKYTPVAIIGTYSYALPHERTIFACYKKTEYSLLGSVQNYRWYSRSGSVSLGWAAIATGAENLAAGAGSFVSGFNNFAAGNFGFVSGRENIGGYAGIVGGYNNNAPGNFSLVGGRDHVVTGLGNLVGGRANTVKSDYGLATGSECETAAGGAYVGGYKSKSLHNNSHVHGLYLESGAAAQTVVGRYNAVLSDALFIIGNGSDGNRSNIFEVRSGEAKVKGSLLTNSLTSGPLSASSATITGYTTIAGALSANSLDITQNAGISGYLTVEQETNTGSLTVQSEAHVIGNTSLDGTLTVGDKATINNALDAGWLTVQGTSKLIGDTEMNAATVSNNITVGNTVNTNKIAPYDKGFITFTKTAIIGTNNTHLFSGNSLALGASNELSGTGDNNTSCNNMYVGGYMNVVQHNNAHVHGRGLKSTAAAQTVVGTFNDLTKTHEFVVGIGTDDATAYRKNALSAGKTGVYLGVNLVLENDVKVIGNNGLVTFGNSVNVSNSKEDKLIYKAPCSFIGGGDNVVGSYGADGTTAVSCNNIYIGGYNNSVAHNNSFVHGLNMHSGRTSQALVGQHGVKSSDAFFVVGAGTSSVPYNGFEVGLEGGNNGTPYVSILGVKFYEEELAKLKELLASLEDGTLLLAKDQQ